MANRLRINDSAGNPPESSQGQVGQPQNDVSVRIDSIERIAYSETPVSGKSKLRDLCR